MGNGAMAKRPQAIAPILDSTSTDNEGCSCSFVGPLIEINTPFTASSGNFSVTSERKMGKHG
jgi:hypothetical protein